MLCGRAHVCSEAPHTQFCSTLVARYFISQQPRWKTPTWPLVFTCLYLAVAGCVSQRGLTANSVYFLDFFPFFHVCVWIFIIVSGKKPTLTENIYVICWPIDPWLTLLGQCGSVPLWRVCKYKCSQHGVGRMVLGKADAGSTCECRDRLVMQASGSCCQIMRVACSQSHPCC